MAVSNAFQQASLPVIGTHDGTFHCDEALACGLLKHTAAFHAASICRTRATDALNQCQVVVDVGGVYDPALQRYDHHQKEFHGTMETAKRKYHTRLSSAGLIYKHFGLELLRSYCDECLKVGRLKKAINDSQMLIIFDRVYKIFVEHIDGIDNGVDAFSVADPSHHKDVELRKNYILSSTLSDRIGRLGPRWPEPQTKDSENSAFVAAMELATIEFFEIVDEAACSWFAARDCVQVAVDGAASVHPSQQIVVLRTEGVPWKDHVMDLEEEGGFVGRTLFVLYPDTSGNWRVQTVPKEAGGFANRKSLPWRGLRDEKLVEASKIPGSFFVHVTGFIGGARTYEGALAMATYALTCGPDE